MASNYLTALMNIIIFVLLSFILTTSNANVLNFSIANIPWNANTDSIRNLVHKIYKETGSNISDDLWFQVKSDDYDSLTNMSVDKIVTKDVLKQLNDSLIVENYLFVKNKLRTYQKRYYFGIAGKGLLSLNNFINSNNKLFGKYHGTNSINWGPSQSTNYQLMTLGIDTLTDNNELVTDDYHGPKAYFGITLLFPPFPAPADFPTSVKVP